MNFIKRFMNGRYGTDQFSFTMLITALVILLFSRLLSFVYLGLIALVLVIYAYFRVFSKNLYKRQNENIKFLSFIKPIQIGVKNTYLLLFGIKGYKYYKCPKCKQILRVPRGKGTIKITCKKCKNEFVKKT